MYLAPVLVPWTIHEVPSSLKPRSEKTLARAARRAATLAWICHEPRSC